MLIGEMAMKVDAFNTLFDEKHTAYAAADRSLDGIFTVCQMVTGHRSAADDVRPICGEAVTVSDGHDRIHLYRTTRSVNFLTPFPNRVYPPINKSDIVIIISDIIIPIDIPKFSSCNAYFCRHEYIAFDE